MLTKAIYTIIGRKFLGNFTWTGKSIPGREKIEFRKLEKINELLYDVLSTIDITYTEHNHLENLINKVLKQA